MTRAFLMDCVEAMRGMKDNEFDLAVVDPVYGGVTQGGYMKNKAGGDAKQRNYHTGLWNQEKTGQEYFRELFRVSKNQIIWGGELLHNRDSKRQSMLALLGQRERNKRLR